MFNGQIEATFINYRMSHSCHLKYMKRFVFNRGVEVGSYCCAAQRGRKEFGVWT